MNENESTQPGLAPGSTWRIYTVTLRHDCGIAKLTTRNTSEAAAIAQICEAEGAPHSAVLNVEEKPEQMGLL